MANDKQTALEAFYDDLAPLVENDREALGRHADLLAAEDGLQDLLFELPKTAQALKGASDDFVAIDNIEARMLALIDGQAPHAGSSPQQPAHQPHADSASGRARLEHAQSANVGAGQIAAGQVKAAQPAAVPSARSEVSTAVSSPRPASSSGNVRALSKGKVALIASGGVLLTIAAAVLIANRPSDVSISALSGTIEQTDGEGLSVVATSGQPMVLTGGVGSVPSGATVRTDARTRSRLRFADGSSVILNHETELTLDARSPRRFVLNRGEVLTDVAHIEDAPHFLIGLPQGEIEVLGTQFAVTVDNDMSSVRVTRGKVDVKSNGRTESVSVGEEALVRAGQAPVVSASVRVAETLAWSELRTPTESQGELMGIGELRARRPGGTEDRRLTIGRQNVRVRIQGNIARTEIEQTFRNDTGEVLEGTYRFPLPSDGQIVRLALDVDGRMEEAAFVEKDRAQQIWRGVIRNATRPNERRNLPQEEFIWVPGPWRDPALLEWQRGGNFELRIFPIPARGERRVVIAYTQQVAPFAGGRRYMYPMAYSRGGSIRVDQFDFEARVGGATAARVRGYNAPVSQDSGQQVVHLTQSGFEPTGDLVIDYQLEGGEREVRAWTFAANQPDQIGVPAAGSPAARALERTRGDAAGFLSPSQIRGRVRDRSSVVDPVATAMQALNADARPYVAIAFRPTLPRRSQFEAQDIAVIVDSSQSMVGERYRRATELAVEVLRGIDRRDRVAVFACDLDCQSVNAMARDGNETSALFEVPNPELAGRVGSALTARDAAGASDLASSIERVAALHRRVGSVGAGSRPLQIIYIGDGNSTMGPSSHGEVLGRLAHLDQGSPRGSVRVSTVGLGTDADVTLLSNIAQRSSGAFTAYVPGEHAPITAMRVLESTYGVALTEAELRLPTGISSVSPSGIRTIHAGEEIWLVGRMDQDRVQGELLLTGRVGGERFEHRYPLDLQRTNAVGNAFVSSLWAQKSIEDLENNAELSTADQTPRIVALSRHYQVMSRHTSLLVLESEAMFRAFGVERNLGASTVWTGDVEAESTESGEVVGHNDEAASHSMDDDMLDGLEGGQGRSANGSGFGVGSGGLRRRAPTARPDSPSAAAPTGSRAFDPAPTEPPAAERAEGDNRFGLESRDQATQRQSALANGAAVSPPAMPMQQPMRPGEWMRRVWFRVADVRPYQGDTSRVRVQPALQALQQAPDSRDRHRDAVRALTQIGDYRRASEIADAWAGRDRLDIEALAARADLAAELGDTSRALRLLSGVLDLAPSNQELRRRVAYAFEAVSDGPRATLVDQGRTSGTTSLLVPPTSCAGFGTGACSRGDIVVEATFNGRVANAVDLALIAPDGTRLSYLNGVSRVFGSQVNAASFERIGLRQARAGTYRIEVIPTSTAAAGTQGSLTIRSLETSRTIPFVVGTAASFAAEVTIRRESRLEATQQRVQSVRPQPDSNEFRTRMASILRQCGITQAVQVDARIEGPTGRATFARVLDVPTAQSQCVDTRARQSLRLTPFSSQTAALRARIQP